MTFSAWKALVVNLAVVALAISVVLYAVPDGFSYILTAIIVAPLYAVMSRLQPRRQPESELASCR